MTCKKILLGILMAATLASCGGGGGSPAVPSGSGSGSGNGGTTTPPTTETPVVAQSTLTLDVLSGSGTSTTSISSAEIAQVKAVLKDAKGAVVKGAIVTFSETGAGLLTFSPAAKTALTDDAGTAVVEVRATSTSSTGATMLTATADVAGTATTGQKAIAISSAPSTGVVDPQTLANAVNFLDVNPADRSIVIAGSGGNGRSESATLRFRVVDKNNSPVKGAAVTFSVTPANDVVLNIVTASSDSDGVVVTTVSSKSVATVVIVQASVVGKSITSQSDQLTVTTGLATQAGFDMSASKYNMNSRKTGDTSKVSVRIVDSNGNPVADGVPVVFTADYGAVGSSSRGGCVTAGGGCDVDYLVQDPRPADGTLATVTASTRLGNGATISKNLRFVMSDLLVLDLFNLPGLSGTEVTTWPISSCAPATLSVYAGTPKAFPAPANTVVTLVPITAGLTATMTNGSPILDQLAATPARTPIDFSVDVSAITGPGACNAAGAARGSVLLDVQFTNDGISRTRRLTVTYPTL